MSGVKFDSGKLEYHQLPTEALEEVIKVLMYGAQKYGSDTNWLEIDDPMTRYYNAAMRHLVAHRKGELVDEETGISPLAHAASNVLFLLAHELIGKEPNED